MFHTSELLKNYKLSTADTSQVCDGSSWETLHDMTQVKSTADGILLDKLKYLPSRAISKGSSESARLCDDMAFEEKRDDATSFLPKTSLGGDNSMTALDLTQKIDSGKRSESSSISNRSVERRASLPLNLSGHRCQPSMSRRGTDGDAPKNVVMRKLSKPMHRNMSSNALSGIMRPSRYSSNNLAAMASVHETGMARVASCFNFDVLQDKPQDDTLSRTSRSTWVAHGVEFSKNMEVYVFKK